MEVWQSWLIALVTKASGFGIPKIQGFESLHFLQRYKLLNIFVAALNIEPRNYIFCLYLLPGEMDELAEIAILER